MKDIVFLMSALGRVMFTTKYFRIFLCLMLTECGTGMTSQDTKERMKSIKGFLSDRSAVGNYDSVKRIDIRYSHLSIIFLDSHKLNIDMNKINQSKNVDEDTRFLNNFLADRKELGLIGFEQNNISELGIGRTFYFSDGYGAFETLNNSYLSNDNWRAFVHNAIDSVGDFKIMQLK